MSRGQLLAGLLVLSLYVVPLLLASAVGTRRLFPEQSRDVRLLISSVLFTTLLTVPAELAGAVGQFRRVPLLGVYLVVGTGAAALALAGRGPRIGRPARERLAFRRPTVLEGCTSALVALLLAAWYVQTRRAQAIGTLGYDSLSYQLPFAVKMFTSGDTFAVPYVQWFLPNDFYPATANIVHAIGMAATDRDVLSPFVSWLWLGEALLAAAVAFRERPARLLSIAGTAVVLLVPGFYTSEAATALVDLTSAAFVLAALALYRRLERSPSALLVIGLAMGLAVGSKLIAAIPAFLLLVGLVLWPGAAARWRPVGAYVGGAVVSGGFWFVRNWVQLGNPLPELDLPLFPATPHLYEYQVFGHPGESVYQPRSIAYYLIHPEHLGSIWTAMYDSFGVLWFVLLGGLIGCAVVGVRRLGLADRVVCGIVLLSVLGYVVTPESAPSAFGRPQQFSVVIETKILMPVLLAGALVLAALLAGARGRAQAAGGLVLLVLGVVEVFRAGIFAAGQWSNWPYARSGHVLAVLLLLAGVALLGSPWRHGPTRAQAGVLTAVGAVGSVAVLVAGVGTWTQGRYRDVDLARNPTVLQALRAAGRSTDSIRVGIQGKTIQTYPYWGPQLQDRVDVLGNRGPHGQFDASLSCEQLLGQLADNDDAVVVLTTRPDVTVPPLPEWLSRDARAKLVLPGRTTAVYVLTGRPSPSSC